MMIMIAKILANFMFFRFINVSIKSVYFEFWFDFPKRKSLENFLPLFSRGGVFYLTKSGKNGGVEWYRMSFFLNFTLFHPSADFVRHLSLKIRGGKKRCSQNYPSPSIFSIFYDKSHSSAKCIHS
jgi:hypothetical protein